MQSSMLKAIVEDFGNGGTIDGDLVVSGDLTVSGGGSLSFDEIIEGTQVIDVTSTEALLVRKNGDGGDVFVVDTTNARVGINNSSPSVNLDFGVTSNNSQIINLRKNSTSVTGLGVNSNFGVRIAGPSDSSEPVSFGEISTSDGTTYTERMRLDSSGRLGIGVSPSYPLHVENSGDTVGYFKSTDNNGQIAVVDDDTTAYFGANGSRAFMGTASGLAGTTNLVVDSNGKVGIGTSSPTQMLHIASPTDAFIQLERVDTTVANNDAIGAILFRGGESSIADIGRIRLHADADFTSSSSPTKMVFETTPSGSTVDAVALTLDSSQNATFAQNINLGDDKALTLGANDDSQIFNTGSHLFIRNNTSDQDIIFQVNDGGSTQTEVMRIDASSSSVGIGIATPYSILHIDSGGDPTSVPTSGQNNIGLGETGTSNGYVSIGFGLSGGTGNYRPAAITYKNTQNGGNQAGELGFWTRNTTTASDAPTQRMVITDGGDVGIGVDSPYNLLHIRKSAVSGSDSHDDDLLVIEENGDHCNINMISDTGSYLMWSDATRNVANINYQHSSGEMGFTAESKFSFNGGAVGVEVSPETDYRSDVTALQVGTSGNIFARKDTGETKIFFAENVKWTSSGFEYINNGSAGYIGLDGGTQTFAVAGSGSADAVASFTTALTINNNGSSTFGGTINANAGINFPDTQASSADVNTLDDYEEGNFTVTIKSGDSGAISAEEGEYVKIGKVVHFRIAFTVGTNFSTQFIDGLPFTSGNSGSPSGLVGAFGVATNTSDDEPIFASAEAGTTTIRFTSGSDVTDAHLPSTTNGTYRFSGTYFAS